jgi:hypothetical protein
MTSIYCERRENRGCVTSTDHCDVPAKAGRGREERPQENSKGPQKSECARHAIRQEGTLKRDSYDGAGLHDGTKRKKTGVQNFWRMRLTL